MSALCITSDELPAGRTVQVAGYCNWFDVPVNVPVRILRGPSALLLCCSPLALGTLPELFEFPHRFGCVDYTF